jgi:hypothetical protein
MGGYGSGRSGGRPTVESALRLDIDTLMRRGVIEQGARVVCEMQFSFYDDELDDWTGEELAIDDKICSPRRGSLRGQVRALRSRAG